MGGPTEVGVDEVAAGRSGSPRRRDDVIADLFAAHHTRLFRLAVLLVDERPLAEDLVQEAFLGLHRRWALLRDDAAAAAYLRTAVVNGSRSALRRRRTTRAHVLEPALPLPSAEERALLAGEHAQVLRAGAELPQRQREVVVLRYWLDLPEAEIADALGIARGSVKAYASRALAALTRRLEEEA